MILDDAEFNHSPWAVSGLQGHHVVAFQKVEEANEWVFQQRPGDIDVCLLDYSIPARALTFAIHLWAYGVRVVICPDSFHHRGQSTSLIKKMNGTSSKELSLPGIVILEEATFCVPEFRFVLDHPSKSTGMIRQVQRCQIGRGDGSRDGYQVMAMDDDSKTEILRTVPIEETRPIKDWGRVLGSWRQLGVEACRECA